MPLSLILLTDVSEQYDPMATFVELFLKALREILLRCRTHRIMWLFRSSSQDGEPARQCSTSQPMPLDVKAVRANMEKLRGYHELAKVSPESPGLPCLSCVLCTVCPSFVGQGMSHQHGNS